MGFSPLVDELRTTRKHSPRPGKVTRMIVHHWAGNGAIDWVLNKFVYSAQQSSVSYILRDSGHLIGSVDEDYRPWTSNGAAADNPAITIEIENSPGPGYRVSDAAIEKLTALLVDVARRHGWKQIRFGHEVRGHREFFNTSCPGPYLWPRLPAIAAEADRRLRGGSGSKPGTSKPIPVPAPSKPSVSSPPVRKIQQDLNRYANAGLYVDGINGPVTKAWIAWVKDVQRTHLPAFKGVPKLVVDGHYGPVVANAVRTLQRRNGLHVDGVLGPVTIAFMRRHGSAIKNRPKNRP